MATPGSAAFSRLQLAAALLEYDNDSTNPNKPLVSAHDSAIFAHLRRGRKSTDYLGVYVPSEAGDSTAGQRRSRGSDILKNPFGADDDDEFEEAGEVDLASWGLDQFIKDKAKGKAKAKSEILPNPHFVATHRNARSVIDDGPRGRSSRTVSIGTMNDFGVGGAFLDENTLARPRSSTDLDQMQSHQHPMQRRRASAHTLIETLPVTPPLHSVPFPSVSIRDGSPGGERPVSRASRLDLHTRTQSNGSILLRDADGNPFAVRPPSPDRASRFDPKVNHRRTMSNATMGTIASMNLPAEEKSFAVTPPSPSRVPRFDPKARARTMSIGSMGTRFLIDNDIDAESHRDRPYSTVELLRPKVLVMPSPLQNVAPPPPPPPAFRPRAGFEISTDGPPLPPGARSANHSIASPSAPIASNSFTPNPRASLTLSQLAFRNALMVGGQRDIAYSDIDRHLPRVMKEGEQVKFEESEEEESPIPVSIPLPPVPPPTEIEIKRPAGRLYGRSLIDNLEHRKAEMKQKARVFTGDERPSMMVRGQIRRSNTFIDPQTLGRPPSQNLDNATTSNPRQSLLRRNSSGGKPLLDMDGERPPTNLGPGAEQLMSKNRSVFGVDTLWEHEMARLKEMEAEERAEVEVQRRREEEEEERRKKKKRAKSKGKHNKIPTTSLPKVPSGTRVGSSPPILPVIQKPVLKRPPPVNDENESESESGDDDYAAPRATSDKAADHWVESSDEDNGPRRIPGIGSRYPSKAKTSTSQLPQLNNESSDEDLPLTAAAQRVARRASQLEALAIDSDSEEDIPLSAAAARVVQRATQLPRYADDEDEDEDEDKPLVDVLNRAKLSLPSVGSLSHHQFGGDKDEDERPLGLRASRLPLASQTSLPFTGGEEDDDRPLAFHPEQQRRTQTQMFAQAQQQQQLMMQAQMQNNMFFNPAMMSSGFFTPMVPPMMMGVPMTPPSPPPAHDAAKFGRVDRWRRDVAVEGES